MREPLVIEIDGRPVPWGRAVPVNIGDRVVPLTPKQTRAYQKLIKTIAGLAMRGLPPYRGPLALTVEATIERPKSVSRLLPWKQGTGDVDNYSKSAQDALNGLAFIDDSQICELVARKRYGKPGLRIIIEQLEEGFGE